jgi:hypothetical protein
MLLAHGGPTQGAVLAFAIGFLVCALVTWVVCWGYRKIVSPRCPRFSRALGWVAWALLLILGVYSLALWRQARGPGPRLSLFLPMWLGIVSSMGALVVCGACRVLNRITRRQDETAFVPDPPLGRASAIGATAAFASLGLLVFRIYLLNVRIRGASVVDPVTSVMLRVADPWTSAILGVVGLLLLMSVVTASMLPAKFWKAAVATVVFCAIGGVIAVTVLLQLKW